jgi:osmotically inducible lipoprotein OsmB
MKRFLAVTVAAGGIFVLAACENIPYSRQTQGAAIGAAAGGVAGHAIGGGGALGTVGGAAIGAGVGSEVGRRQDQRR